MEGTTKSVETGEVLRALANQRRRQLVRVLGESVGTVTFDYLLDELSRGPEGPDGPDSGQVAVSLRHSHLPILEEAGIITRDESGRIRYRQRTLVREVLEACS